MKLAVHHGIAGQLSIDVKVLMASDLYDVGFVGTQYGSPGPIIMVMGQVQTVISSPERFGERFNEQWVRAFYDSDMLENHAFAHRTEATCIHCGDGIARLSADEPWFHGSGKLSIWCGVSGGPQAEPSL